MKHRVLIADDEKNMRWVLSQALEADGYEILEAADGKEALSIVAEQAPDILAANQPAKAALRAAGWSEAR